MTMRPAVGLSEKIAGNGLSFRTNLDRDLVVSNDSPDVDNSELYREVSGNSETPRYAQTHCRRSVHRRDDNAVNISTAWNGVRRPGTLEDFNTITRLCEQSRHVQLIGPVPVEPSDMPVRSRPVPLVHSLMRFSYKPLIGVAATRKEAEEVFDVIKIVFGSDDILDRHVAIAYSVNPTSPLCFEPLSRETLVAHARRKQALQVLPGLMAGVTGPPSLFGLVALSNAEILAALVCAQLIRSGTPVVYADVLPGSHAAITRGCSARMVHCTISSRALGSPLFDSIPPW